MVLPFRLLGGWAGVGLTTVHGLGGVQMFIIMCQSRQYRWFSLLGFCGGGGVGLTTVHGSGCWNVSYHVPIQIIPMVLPFRLLRGWGG